MRAHGQAVTEDGLDAIIRRCDTDEDEALSFDEFSDVFRDTAFVHPVEVARPYDYYRPSTVWYDRYHPAYTSPYRYSTVKTTAPFRATRSPVRATRVAPLLEASPYRSPRARSPYRSPYRSFY